MKSEKRKTENRFKILIVDDDINQVYALEKLMEPMELEVYTAFSGQEALKLMIHHEFILVLLDIVMPEMNGLEVAKIMRDNKRTEMTPIIFTTAYNKDEVDLIEGYKMGAVDYIIKPVNKEILLSKIRVFKDFKEFEREKEREYQKLLEKLKEKNEKLELARTAALNMLEDANHASRDSKKIKEILEESTGRDKSIKLCSSEESCEFEKIVILKDNKKK